MDENEQKAGTPVVSQVARDAHEDAAGATAEGGCATRRPFAALAKPLRKRTNHKTAPPEDMTAARERMEQSILDRRKASTHCPMCGALGNWKTDSVKKPLRYLLCGGCGVGRCQIAVMPEEAEQALGIRH